MGNQRLSIEEQPLYWQKTGKRKNNCPQNTPLKTKIEQHINWGAPEQ
jgi:hypothetical protein